MKAKASPALSIMRMVWEHRLEKTGPSWCRLNGALQCILNSLIQCGVPFGEGDFATLYDDMRGQFWFGTDASGMGERFYSTASTWSHTSACQSFEAWKKRPAFILCGKRLHEGAEAEVNGETWKVTSLKDEYVNLTQSRRNENGYGMRVVKRRKLNRDDIAAIHKSIRDHKKEAAKQATSEVEE